MNTEEPLLDDYGKVLLQLLIDKLPDLQQALNFILAYIRRILLLVAFMITVQPQSYIHYTKIQTF